MTLISINCELDDKISQILEFLETKHVIIPNLKYSTQQDDTLDLISYKLLSEYEGITLNQLKRELGKVRHQYELISIEPKSPGMAALAARDGRVDLVRISSRSSLSIFNNRYAHRLSENNKIVELDISSFFDRHLAKHLRPLLRVLATFHNVSLQYHLTNLPSNQFELRSYRGLQAIGRKLGLSNADTKEHHLLNRLQLNRDKLTGRIPMPGVEVIEW
jgi:RNase P/RNase MRP subunit p30